MKVKVDFNKEIHITTAPTTFEEFKNYVSETFHGKLPGAWYLKYLDSEGDDPCICSQEEYEDFLSLEPEHQGKFARVYVISTEGAKDATVREVKEEPPVQNTEDKLAKSEYQVIKNSEVRGKIDEELQMEQQESVIEEIVSEVLVGTYVSEKQEIEENKDEKAGQFFMNPRKNKMMEESVLEGYEILKNVPYAKSELYILESSNKEEQKSVAEEVVSEVPVDIKIDDDVSIIVKQESEIKGKIQQEEEEKLDQEDQQEEVKYPKVERNEALDLIETLKNKVASISNSVASFMRPYKFEASQSQGEVAPERGDNYIEIIHKEFREMKKFFCNEEFIMLCA